MSVNAFTKARGKFGALIVGNGLSDGGKGNTLAIGAITGVSAAANAVVTSAGHGLQVGQSVNIAGVVGTGLMTAINGGPFTITAVSTNTFTVAVATTAGVYTSGGTVTLVVPTVVPSTAASTTTPPGASPTVVKGIYSISGVTVGVGGTTLADGADAVVSILYPGVSVGDVIVVVPPAALEAGLGAQAVITAANTITITFSNLTSTGLTGLAAHAWSFLWIRLV